MKKLKKENVIKLLEARKCSYKGLSQLTGYHEKSLIRLNSLLKKGEIIPVHGNKNKKTHNYIDILIRNMLIKEYEKGNFKTYMQYYLFLKEKNKNYSYSFITKLLSNNAAKFQENEPAQIIKRKMISNNIIQYKNIRYAIINGNIKHLAEVKVHESNSGKLYLLHNNKKYELRAIKKINSRKGLTKYY